MPHKDLNVRRAYLRTYQRKWRKIPEVKARRKVSGFKTLFMNPDGKVQMEMFIERMELQRPLDAPG